MFILYGLLAGFAAGLVMGGRPGGLADLRLRWVPVVLAGMLVQLVLFSGPVSDRIGALGPVLYVGSTAFVLAAVVRNARLPGLPIVALGAAANLAAITSNGGFMPARTTGTQRRRRSANPPGRPPMTSPAANPASSPYRMNIRPPCVGARAPAPRATACACTARPADESVDRCDVLDSSPRRNPRPRLGSPSTFGPSP